VPPRIRVLIADDQTLVRTGFRVILEAEGDIEVIAEADTGREAVRQAQLTVPDVILMDIRMPEMDGLTATEEILRQPHPPTIVMLTTFDQNEYVYRALRAGAAGFLLKDAPATRLVAAVRVAATGDSLIEPSITQRLLERFAEPAGPVAHPAALAALTERELDVLRLVARGLSNAEIAAELVVAETTVKTHVARILAKLAIRDRVQAVVVAYETGFVARGPGG
jgi:DNA-binding NarL/FixJ family response regulator